MEISLSHISIQSPYQFISMSFLPKKKDNIFFIQEIDDTILISYIESILNMLIDIKPETWFGLNKDRAKEVSKIFEGFEELDQEISELNINNSEIKNEKTIEIVKRLWSELRIHVKVIMIVAADTVVDEDSKDYILWMERMVQKSVEETTEFIYGKDQLLALLNE